MAGNTEKSIIKATTIFRYFDVVKQYDFSR